jgi:hypothetical protein
MSFNNANVLIQQFVQNYGNTTRSYRVIDFVRDVSRANNNVRLNPNDFIFAGGKLRQVRMNYFPILCDTDGNCDTQTLCSTGEVVEPKQQIFNIDRCIASKVFAINKDDIRQIDYNTWDFNGTALEIINHALPSIRRSMAIEWETLLYSMAGIHPDGNETHRVTVTDPTRGIVNPIGRFEIEREYMDAGFTSPYILGGAEVYNWEQMVRIGGLNAQGQRIDQLSTERAYYDDGLGDLILNDTANGSHILAIAPETFKYVYFLQNAGIFRTDMASINDLGMLYRGVTGGYLEGVIIDPVTGIPWDLFIRYDECTGQWNLWFKHTYNFFVMPDVACNIQGVNGIMHYRTCPYVIADCPTGTTPSPAVSAQSYAWTPGDIFPLYVATSNIGGVINQPAILVSNLTELAAMMNDNYAASIFAVSGSAIRYNGYSAITGNLNDGAVTITFA